MSCWTFHFGPDDFASVAAEADHVGRVNCESSGPPPTPMETRAYLR